MAKQLWCLNIRWQEQTWNVKAGLECHSDALCSYDCTSNKWKLNKNAHSSSGLLLVTVRAQKDMDCANRFILGDTQYSYFIIKCGIYLYTSHYWHWIGYKHTDFKNSY